MQVALCSSAASAPRLDALFHTRSHSGAWATGLCGSGIPTSFVHCRSRRRGIPECGGDPAARLARGLRVRGIPHGHARGYHLHGSRRGLRAGPLAGSRPSVFRWAVALAGVGEGVGAPPPSCGRLTVGRSSGHAVERWPRWNKRTGRPGTVPATPHVQGTRFLGAVPDLHGMPCLACTLPSARHTAQCP